MSTLSSVPDRKPIESVLELYRLEEGVDPYIATKIGILRQLINEEFVSKNKLVSSQFIYDILKDGINQQIKSVLDELEGECRGFLSIWSDEDDLSGQVEEDAVPLSTIQKIRSRYE